MAEDYKASRICCPKLVEARIRMIALSAAIRYKKKTWNSGGFPLNADNRIEIKDEEDLFNYLKDNGPLYAAYYWTEKEQDGKITNHGHIVIVTGMDLANGLVYTNNPHGVKGIQTFEDFLNCFATSGDTNLLKCERIDIYTIK